MSTIAEFVYALSAALDTEPNDTSNLLLTTLLESNGFVFGARSVTNLRLLSQILPPEFLREITLASMSTPMPDMAINGLERISTVIPREDLLFVCSNNKYRSQLAAICGSSSFLTSIIYRDPNCFRDLFINQRIDLRRSDVDILSTLRASIPEDTNYMTLFSLLRRFKYSEILRIAARDLNGLASFEEVTAELSGLAAACLQIACEVSRRQLIAEYGVPLMEAPDRKQEAYLTVLGMGKLGGQELNFSSDIDLIYFYSSDEGETSGVTNNRGITQRKVSLHTFFVKQAEMISKAIAQVTADGFVFRVDLRLRPEGNCGDMAISQRSAEMYYESWGQSWERAAMLKARPVAGSQELGEQFLKAIEPFIYRRYLDYNLIEDMMGMKKKIDASIARNMEGEYNIKLGRGGIREIEFFIQALQLVYAGKNPSLRRRNSLQALESLKDAHIIQDDDCTALGEAYRFLRTVEHRIQMVQERQTHSLPRKDDEFHALARRSGYTQTDGAFRFSKILEEHRNKVSAIYGNLFLSRDEKLKGEVRPEIYFFFDQKADPDLVKDMLAERHFENVDAAYDHLLLLREGPPQMYLTERAHRLLEKIAPLFLQEIFASPDPDMALNNLERFLYAIGSRSYLYAMLAETHEILKLVVSLFSMSEFLSKIFIGHPEIIDNLISSLNVTYIRESEDMACNLEAMLEQSEHFEESLNILRRFRHEEFLCIGMNDIHGNLGQTDIASQLTNLAEVCLTAAYRLAVQELARFGRPEWTDNSGERHEAHLAIVSMGKMGGNELNYHSDLDIIYIYDRHGYTSGKRQIANHEYFAKLGQKIISILTMQTREGYVYKIDTRLRPSGNAGPLVTSLASFSDYHLNDAQVWERQALTKARVVLGEDGLTENINKILQRTVYDSSTDETVHHEIDRLRMRMENELAKERKGSYNIKTGRGGMVDVEFIVQYLQLKHGHNTASIRSLNTLNALKAMRDNDILTSEDADILITGYKFLRRLENRLRIIHDHSINDLGGSLSYLNKLARRLNYDPALKNPGATLMKEYEEMTEKVRGVYDRILGEKPAH